MDVSVLDSSGSECEDFVQQWPEAKLCHMPAWTAMVENTFGHKGYYLTACEDSRICGVLPLTYVRSRLFGRRLISQPFSDYGGMLATSPAARDALYERAVEIARQNRCAFIEFRNTAALPYDLHVRADKISMCLPLARDPQEVWKGLRHKTRNRVSKAEREGFSVVSGGPELLDQFYGVWAVRMHELGTPCYSRRLFRSIMEMFPAESRIFLAQVGGVTAAVLFAYTFHGRVQCSWGAALRGYDEAGPNYILNWKAIEHYCGAGLELYDFGRSTVGSGQYTFKERWGATPVDLCWQYWTPQGKELHLVRPEESRYHRRVEMWKKLPLKVTLVLGPCISCSLP